MFVELLDLIEEEQKLYSIKRDQHLHSMHLILQKQYDEPQIDEATQHFAELRDTAYNVQQEVEAIQSQSEGAMRSFESLRHQKSNIEAVLNTSSALVELRRIRSLLPRAIEARDLSLCLKLSQSFLSIQDVVLKEFCGVEYQTVKALIDLDLVRLQKEEFEDALKQNDLNRINVCACLSKVLNQEYQHSLERVQEVHEKELRRQLMLLEDNMFERVNTKYEEYIRVIIERAGDDLDARQYDFPFLWHFESIVQATQSQCQRFISSIQGFYGEQGLDTLIRYLIQQVSVPFLTGVIRRVLSFFGFEPRRQAAEPQKPHKPTLLLQVIQNQQRLLESDKLAKLSLFCEEVTAIAGLLNQFLLQMSEIGTKQVNKYQDLSVNGVMIDALGVYLQQAKDEVHEQLLVLFQKSESLQALWNFDKNKISPLSELKEQLHGNTFHEWLEEAFFLLKHSMLVAMSCGNQMISSTFINYVSIDIICEELYQVVTQLVNRYLRKEYFSSNGICINSKYSVHNAFIALLLNICSNIPKYLRTLKAHLYNEMNQYPQSQMLVAAIEEMVDSNHQKYTAFVQEKLKNLSENLKLTTRSLFEQIRTLNFAVNDNIIVEQEREYSKIFSQQFKQVYSQGLDQWHHQFTALNYEYFSIQLAISIAKTLEHIITSKQYYQMGAILLEKEVRNIVNFMCTTTSANVKQKFSRLQMICGTLMLESVKDMEEFLSSSAVGEVSVSELNNMASLRLDLQ